jgi:hypothetical protein
MRAAALNLQVLSDTSQDNIDIDDDDDCVCVCVMSLPMQHY